MSKPIVSLIKALKEYIEVDMESKREYWKEKMRLDAEVRRTAIINSKGMDEAMQRLGFKPPTNNQ